MARTTTVKHNRKERTCKVCQEPIRIGDPYKWVHPRYRMRVDAHPNCTIPASMTSSSKMVAVWSAQEEYAKLTTPADKRADAELMAETIREVAGEYSEAASSQQEFFPDSEVAQENEDKGNELEAWADEIESKASEIEELDEDDEVIELRAKVEAYDPGDETNEDAMTLEELEEQLQRRLEEVEDESDISELDDLVQACPV